MHCVGSRGPGCVNDLVNDQVTLCGGAAPEGECLVGKAHMQRIAIRIGIDRHRLQAGILAGANDSDGDLAAVCDQDGTHKAPSIWWRRAGNRYPSPALAL